MPRTVLHLYKKKMTFYQAYFNCLNVIKHIFDHKILMISHIVKFKLYSHPFLVILVEKIKLGLKRNIVLYFKKGLSRF